MIATYPVFRKYTEFLPRTASPENSVDVNLFYMNTYSTVENNASIYSSKVVLGNEVESML